MNLNSGNPTFIDQFGVGPAVPEGAVHGARGGRPARRLRRLARAKRARGSTLIDPNGTYAATRARRATATTARSTYTPAAGNWTAIVFLRDGTFTGPVHLEFASQSYGAVAP